MTGEGFIEKESRAECTLRRKLMLGAALRGADPSVYGPVTLPPPSGFMRKAMQAAERAAREASS